MMQQETGGLNESEDFISVTSRLCQIHNEKTGCYLMSPCMGLARDRPVGEALR